MEYAKQLLLNENDTVNDIASRAGYGSVSHFIKVFRSYTGLTSDVYRKTMCADRPARLGSDPRDGEDSLPSDRPEPPEDPV